MRAAVDLSGRPYVVHDEPALAPYIGPVYPTSMTRHIWESFGHAARITLHVNVLRAARAGGQPDAHHVVEAQFKAVARALREAVAIDPRDAGAMPEHQGRALMSDRAAACSSWPAIAASAALIVAASGRARREAQHRPGRRGARGRSPLRRRRAAWLLPGDG